MISILGAGCSTAAGPSITSLMSGLNAGRNYLTRVPTESWPVKPTFEPFAFRFPEREQSVRETLLKHLSLSFHEALGARDLEGTYGVILASTKGLTEDVVWTSSSDIDPLTPLLDDFISRHQLKPSRKICVSNACASSLAALALARMWLVDLDHVIVLAADSVDSFVLHGFNGLRVLTNEVVRPFDGKRSGFYLGDAAACVLLSRKISSDTQLIDARFDSEGYAVTRPSHSGESLLRACRQIEGVLGAELVIAHGTATRANDETEDRVFSALFESAAPPAITGTKWMIGHTLGASGLIDTIVAREAIRAQSSTALMTTKHIDPKFKGRYVLGHTQVMPIKKVLVTSLGFGGVHAAALVGAT